MNIINKMLEHHQQTITEAQKNIDQLRLVSDILAKHPCEVPLADLYIHTLWAPLSVDLRFGRKDHHDTSAELTLEDIPRLVQAYPPVRIFKTLKGGTAFYPAETVSGREDLLERFSIYLEHEAAVQWSAYTKLVWYTRPNEGVILGIDAYLPRDVWPIHLPTKTQYAPNGVLVGVCSAKPVFQRGLVEGAVTRYAQSTPTAPVRIIVSWDPQPEPPLQALTRLWPELGKTAAPVSEK